MRTLAALVLLTALLGCSAQSRMPTGFNEACYGGDFGKNLAGVKPIYSATLSLERPSRPALREMLLRLADKHHLKAFDDGAAHRDEFFSVYLCSSKGAFTLVDSRAAEEGMVHINVFSYHESWHSDSFVDDLQSELTSQWPRGLQKNNVADTTLRNSVL